MELSTLILIVVFVMSFVYIKRVDTNIHKHNAMASVYYKRLNDLYTNASYFM